MGLQKIIEVRIGSLIEEVEIATNVKLNHLYVIDLIDEIASLQWVTRIIRWILDEVIDGRHSLATIISRMELEDTKKFENMIHDKIQELKTELEDSNTVKRERSSSKSSTYSTRCLGSSIQFKTWK